jgi:hypothetical protein
MSTQNFLDVCSLPGERAMGMLSLILCQSCEISIAFYDVLIAVIGNCWLCHQLSSTSTRSAGFRQCHHVASTEFATFCSER